VRADGTGLRRLAVTPKLQGLSSLAWSPDSSQVIWSDTRGVMSVAVRTGSVRRLTYLRGEFEDVAWAPSWRILFSNSGRLYSLVPGGRPVRLF
jgi:hypothetical protein